MIRRFNYTGRKRIDQQRINIEIDDADEGRFPSFTAELNLDGLDLPTDALLIIEAKRELSSRRFDWGCVGNPTPPSDCELTDIPSNPKFRVMVIESECSRRLLALANDVSPRRIGTEGEIESMLWLEEADLGEEVWRLDFGEPGDNPKMQVNQNIQGISAAVRRDDFRSLVMPEALRLILTRALIVEDEDPSNEQSSWSDWIGFVRSFYDAEIPHTADDSETENAKVTVSEWIQGAVETFAQERFRARDLYISAREQ